MTDAAGHQPSGPRGTHSEARIEAVAGRFVLWLDVWLDEPAEDGSRRRPAGSTSRRIGDYASRRDAEIAADWIVRATRRGARATPPPRPEPPSPPSAS